MSEEKPDKLDEFLAYLAMDGGWHSLEEVAGAIQVAKGKALVAARFFSRFGFVEFDREAGRVRIDPKIRAWYTEP
jgi:DNA-binding IclR family transcriptional regulator